MTAPTGLGQYNKPQGSQGDRIQAQQMVDRPILVKVIRSEWKNKTKFSENGGEAVFFDMIDLSTNAVYIEVMWMAGAIVDGLKQYAGDGNVYPVKVVKVTGGAHGSYQTIESLGEDPQWMNHVMSNLAAFQNLLIQTRAQREQEWATAMRQPPAPPQVPSGPPAPPALTPAGAPGQYGPPPGGAAPSPPMQQPQYQQQAPPPPPAAAPPVQQPAQDPAYAAWLASQQREQQIQAAPPGAPTPPMPAPSPPQPTYSPAGITANSGPYEQAMALQPPHVQQAIMQAQAQPPAAVAPPQYQPPQPPAGVPGPPPAQQYQQAPAAPQYGAPPAGLPTPPGAVTGATVDQLQQKLAALG